uniref:Uncharacterized protein n=1 Tax=Ixodes ricinus TaxID=34613 RepID=A0A6B0U7W1_IXORI
MTCSMLFLCDSSLSTSISATLMFWVYVSSVIVFKLFLGGKNQPVQSGLTCLFSRSRHGSDQGRRRGLQLQGHLERALFQRRLVAAGATPIA